MELKGISVNKDGKILVLCKTHKERVPVHVKKVSKMNKEA